MFQPGEKVACVIDDWPDSWKGYTDIFPLGRGRCYAVRRALPDGSILPCGAEIAGHSIGIGVTNQPLRIAVLQIGMTLSTYDIWPIDWFRRLQRNDESVTRAMSIFHQMTETTKAPEVIDA